MKHWFIILAIVVCHQQQLYLAHEASSRFFKVECSSSGLTLKAPICFVKAYSRNLTTVNFSVVLKRDLMKVYCKYDIEYKYGSFYRNLWQTASLDWCSFMNGDFQNVVHTMLIDVLKQSSPHLFHKCPYKGAIKVDNMTLDLDKFKFMFPAGVYRTKVLLFDDYDSEILKLAVYNTIRLPSNDSTLEDNSKTIFKLPGTA
ncbi:unnamed protein product [Diamesa serratosioi]